MLIHTGEKQHVCPECDQRFTQAVLLSRDHMLIHTGDKQHVCPECDKRFRRCCYISRDHMLIHTGDKHHVCPECDKWFTQAGSSQETHANSYRRKTTCMSRM